MICIKCGEVLARAVAVPAQSLVPTLTPEKPFSYGITSVTCAPASS